MALLDTFSCPRRPRLTPTRALWARVGATGHAVVLSHLGSRLALKRAPKGAGGSEGRVLVKVTREVRKKVIFTLHGFDAPRV